MSQVSGLRFLRWKTLLLKKPLARCALCLPAGGSLTRKFATANGVKHVTGAHYYPSTNGQAERLAQSFKKGVKADKFSRTLQHKLDRFVLAYRSVPHAVTELSPAQLLLGRNVKTRLKLIKPDVSREVNKKLLQSNNRT